MLAEKIKKENGEEPDNERKTPEHLNRGDSCWEKPIKAAVSLNQVA